MNLDLLSQAGEVSPSSSSRTAVAGRTRCVVRSPRVDRRIAKLEAEVEILRRLADFKDINEFLNATEPLYRFIEANREDFTVKLLCKVVKVSRSSYYAWVEHRYKITDSIWREAHLANEIFTIWLGSKKRYGSPRITMALRERGRLISDNTVAEIMAAIGICGKSGRKKVKTTIRDKDATPAKDLVERNFSATTPHELWLTDITYIPTDEGFLYLCAILDVFTRRLVGWSMATHMATELCLDALNAAMMSLRVSQIDIATILHSDHGCQFTSHDFTNVCELLGITQSMGTVGDSYDNAMMESAWGSLKRELVDDAHFATKSQARKEVFEWILWYNNERLHSSIGYTSPVKFEKSWHQQNAA